MGHPLQGRIDVAGKNDGMGGPRCYCQFAPCERIKQIFTCRVQRFMHLLSFVPAPGLAHLPTQFEKLSSHRAADIASVWWAEE
jgi:hypothetical protein